MLREPIRGLHAYNANKKFYIYNNTSFNDRYNSKKYQFKMSKGRN